LTFEAVKYERPVYRLDAAWAWAGALVFVIEVGTGEALLSPDTVATTGDGADVAVVGLEIF